MDPLCWVWYAVLDFEAVFGTVFKLGEENCFNKKPLGDLIGLACGMPAYCMSSAEVVYVLL